MNLNSTKDWLKEKKCNGLEWLHQCPDHNPIEMLWNENRPFTKGSQTAGLRNGLKSLKADVQS